MAGTEGTGEQRREHWIVPVHGPTPADPGGTVQASALRDGSVVLHLTCGDCKAEVRLDVCRAAHRSAPPRGRSSRVRRRPSSVNNGAAMDATRLIGLRIQRIRVARNKSLRVISGLAGMSSSTLHRIEHGLRELTLSEIVALAGALEIAPARLTTSTMLAPTRRD